MTLIVLSAFFSDLQFNKIVPWGVIANDGGVVVQIKKNKKLAP